MFESQAPFDPAVREAYLARLGVDAEAPSAVGLRLIVQRQLERVPYETMWIQAGEGWGIDPIESARRIACEGRGGYCYHMNGALGLLLGSLGYVVRGHVGGVHGPKGPKPEEMGNHLVLTVERLPTDDNASGVWYVDAGLGDALHEPLPLRSGSYRQPPFQLSVEQDSAAAWHLTHDPAGGFSGMSWSMDLARLTDFEAQHRWLSTSTESGFVQVAMAERRDATGVDVVRGLVLTRIGQHAHTAEPVTNRKEWFELLAEMFDLRFETSTAESRDRLWTNVLAAHRRWQAAGQSPA
jgi:N-hydroxyarylamine O-acetyltransferase